MRTPHLLVDTDLRIRAVNKAYELATARDKDSLIGELLFDAFPDNPADPDSDGVAAVAGSLDLVFRRGARHSLGVQRYDIPDRERPGEFMQRVWTPVHSPITVDGRTVAALHQTQDVTSVVSLSGPAFSSPAGSSLAGSSPSGSSLSGLYGFEQLVPLLQRRFPTVPENELIGVITQSYSVVAAALQAPDLEQTVELASLRLELRNARPANHSG